MRPTVFVDAPGRGRGGQKSRMATHDEPDIDAGQGPEIKVHRQEGAGDEFGSRDEAGRMVVLDKVVVDGLRRVHKGDGASGRVGQDLLRSRRVVAADVDEGV